jgi:hypothetical protein
MPNRVKEAKKPKSQPPRSKWQPPQEGNEDINNLVEIFSKLVQLAYALRYLVDLEPSTSWHE